MLKYLPDILHLQTIYYSLMIVGAIVGIVGRTYLKRKGIALLSVPQRVSQFFLYFLNFPKEFAEYAETSRNRFKGIEAELSPNGGGSMRDAINRIDTATVHVANKMRFVDDCSPRALFEISVRKVPTTNESFFQFTYVNPMLCRMLGYPSNQLDDVRMISKITDAERESFLELWDLSMKTGSPFESRNHIEHGETKMPLFVKFVAQPQFNPRGELTHYFGHVEHATRANLGAPGGI